MNMNKTLLAIVGIAVVLGGWWLVEKNIAVPATGDTVSTESVATTSPSVPVRGEQAEEQSLVITISGSEFKYEPAMISAKVGQTVTVTYTNTGKYSHNFVIDELGVKSQTIKAGETQTFSFVPDKTGTFAFYCSLPSHREKGMSGVLTVK